jgi:hypothetical protein
MREHGTKTLGSVVFCVSIAFIISWMSRLISKTKNKKKEIVMETINTKTRLIDLMKKVGRPLRDTILEIVGAIGTHFIAATLVS